MIFLQKTIRCVPELHNKKSFHVPQFKSGSIFTSDQCKDGPGLAIDVVKVSTNQRAGLRTTDQSQAWILTMKLPW